MAGKLHEFRDPIHVFVRMDSDERRVVDSDPFQRLRHIHQLAMTFLVYPGATHRRFEHCLGVMEVSGRIFDVVTNSRNLANFDSVKDILPEERLLGYWRFVLRMAALCHDLGHLPFSHGPEDLLPSGISHEDLSLALIRSPQMEEHWQRMKLQTEDIAKVAVGQKKYGKPLTNWESILAEIVVGDAFGADRIDYLLRDSHHAGVSYGRFDHYRLIDTLRILPKGGESEEPTLGIEEGGLQSAESLLWARHFMYTQLYFHPVRRIYDIHLKEFLQQWLPDGKLPVTVEGHLALTDNDVLSAIAKASSDKTAAGYEPARRIAKRQHFRVIYKRNPTDQQRNKLSAPLVYDALRNEFGEASFRFDKYTAKSTGINFPVLTGDGRIEQSTALSETLEKVPTFAVGTVFASKEIGKQAGNWLKEHHDRIIPADVEPENKQL